ncbi:hypothetical protein AVEN_240126-1 [Araneus ventricosus]|uniref:Uncharacterized protein n=1 Tax=Araneus ventricosus TaxID=182803 RepID=A0A4Y2SRG9_ARAVE|nr:hypothetical protein AVEN_240126-1 [Araneus ventricosus]
MGVGCLPEELSGEAGLHLGFTSRKLRETSSRHPRLYEQFLAEVVPVFEKVQALFEIVEREISLELDKEADSVSNAARKVLSEEVMQDLCLKEFSVCKDFLQLLAIVGGDEAEKVCIIKLKVI